MPISLYKWGNTAQDRDFRNKTNENWTTLENGFNEIEQNNEQVVNEAKEQATQITNAVNQKATFFGTNLLKNGNFSGYGTGWNANGGTGSVANNTFRVQGDGTTNVVGIRNITENNFIGKAGHKIYVKATIRTLNVGAEGISIYLTDGTSFAYLNNQVNNISKPIKDSWYNINGIAELPPSLDGKSIKSYFVTRFTDNATAVGKYTEIYGSLLSLDLTEIFGAGNEPSVVEIDDMLSKFTNKWFDGTSELIAVKELLQKKVSKFDFETHKNTENDRMNLVEKDTMYPATNLLKNGDFYNWGADWNPNGGTGTVANNTFTILGDSSTKIVGLRNITENNFAGKSGHKIFMKGSIRVTNSSAEGISIYLTDDVGTDFVYLNNQVNIVLKPIKDAWYHISGVLEIPSSLEGKSLKSYFVARYPDTITANGKATEIYGSLLALDLTEIYGSGNEPNKSEVLSSLSKYTNSWFNGTIKSFTTIKEQVKNAKQNNELEFGFNNFTTVPTFTNGLLTKIEATDGLVVKKRTILSYNPDGTVNNGDNMK
ncbi:hypothetical protein FOA24_02905 [Bacillus thuringiensis]|uniref:hypothetical protein n=1 Tax=Bacillus thuringiensis TaxID=1428 RepID=UPI00333A8435